MAELNELFKTLFLYGWCTGFIPILGIIVVFGMVWYGFGYFWNYCFHQSHNRKWEELPPELPPEKGLSRAEYFERERDG
jgi:hypothetical protein